MSLLAPPARVLVRAPSWLGDFVAAEPVLRALHARWRAAGAADRITIAAPAPFLELLAGKFQGVRHLPVARGASPDASAWRGHDVALLLDGSLRSAWAAFVAGIPQRIGWGSGLRAPLLTLAIRPALERGAVPLGLGVRGRRPRRLPRPFASACVELAALAGLEVRERAPRLRAHVDALTRAKQRLAARGVDADAPFVLVNAGARAGSAKGADPDLLGRALAGLDVPIAIACGPGEEENARRTAQALAGARAVLLDDPAPALDELLALVALAHVVVTPDSGPRHLAQAVPKRAVVLCGPTDPRHTADYRAPVTVLRAEVDCGPCHREACPRTGERERACMRSIDAAALSSAVAAAVARRSLQPRPPG